ncbi:hypothetical protein fugu_019692, partial [Takifugu bimaculatus]
MQPSDPHSRLTRWRSLIDALSTGKLTEFIRSASPTSPPQRTRHPEVDICTGCFVGNDLPVQYLRLLAPPLQLLSAAVWQVVQQGLVDHYGMLEEFVTMVTELVPELMSYSQKAQLIMGLRARLVLEMCRGEHPVDMQAIQPHLDRIKAPVSTAKDHHVKLAEKQILIFVFYLHPTVPVLDPQEGSFSVIKDAKVPWSDEETLHLLDIWGKDTVQRALKGCLKNRHIFTQIAQKMAERGYMRSVEQCQTRIKRLKANFRQFLEGR